MLSPSSLRSLSDSAVVGFSDSYSSAPQQRRRKQHHRLLCFDPDRCQLPPVTSPEPPSLFPVGVVPGWLFCDCTKDEDECKRCRWFLSRCSQFLHFCCRRRVSASSQSCFSLRIRMSPSTSVNTSFSVQPSSLVPTPSVQTRRERRGKFIANAAPGPSSFSVFPSTHRGCAVKENPAQSSTCFSLAHCHAVVAAVSSFPAPFQLHAETTCDALFFRRLRVSVPTAITDDISGQSLSFSHRTSSHRRRLKLPQVQLSTSAHAEVLSFLGATKNGGG